MTRRVPFPFLAVPEDSWQPTGRQLTRAEARTLAVLTRRWCRGHDVIRISKDGLASEAGISREQVKRALRKLIADGLVQRESGSGGRGQWASYRLTLPEEKRGHHDPLLAEHEPSKRGHHDPLSTLRHAPMRDRKPGHGDPVSAPLRRRKTGSRSATNGVKVTPTIPIEERGRPKAPPISTVTAEEDRDRGVRRATGARLGRPHVVDDTWEDTIVEAPPEPPRDRGPSALAAASPPAPTDWPRRADGRLTLTDGFLAAFAKSVDPSLRGIASGFTWGLRCDRIRGAWSRMRVRHGDVDSERAALERCIADVAAEVTR